MLVLTKNDSISGVTAYRAIDLHKEAKASLSKRVLRFVSGDQEKATKILAMLHAVAPIEKYLPKFVVGYAFCALDDSFNEDFGKRLARTRCLRRYYQAFMKWEYAMVEFIDLFLIDTVMTFSASRDQFAVLGRELVDLAQEAEDMGEDEDEDEDEDDTE